VRLVEHSQDAEYREPAPSDAPEPEQPPRDSPDPDEHNRRMNEHNRQVVGATVPATPRTIRNLLGRVIE